MEKDRTTKRTAYQVYVKIKGIWFEGSFPAKGRQGLMKLILV